MKLCKCVKCDREFQMDDFFQGKILCEDCDPLMAPYTDVALEEQYKQETGKSARQWEHRQAPYTYAYFDWLENKAGDTEMKSRQEILNKISSMDEIRNPDDDHKGFVSALLWVLDYDESPSLDEEGEKKINRP